VSACGPLVSDAPFRDGLFESHAAPHAPTLREGRPYRGSHSFGRGDLPMLGLDARFLLVYSRIHRVAPLALVILAVIAATPGTSRTAPLFAAPFLSFDAGESPRSVAI